MSGFQLGAFRPVETPDLGATLSRMAAIDAQRQQTALARQAFEQDQGFNRTLAAAAPGLASGQGPAYDSAVASIAAAGPRGLTVALPLLQRSQDRRELQGIIGGGAAPAVAPARGDYTARMVSMESGGDPNARNPRSSATGAGQFIDSTWLQFAQANPALFQGMSREQVLAARNDPNLSRQAVEWYRRENSGALAAQGLPANDGTAALAHRFGPQGAAALLRADPNAPIDSVVGQQVMAANPDLSGRTVGQVVQGYAQRFGGGAIPASAPAAAPRGGMNLSPQQWAQVETLAAAGNPGAMRMLQIRQMSAQNNPEQYVTATENIGGRQVQGQRNTRTGQFTPFPGQTGAEQTGPFSGNSMDAQANNVALSLADKVRAGTATPAEQALYQRAYSHLAGGTIQYVVDPSDPTGLRQVAVRVPRDMGDLPAPGGGAAPGQAAPQQGMTTPTQGMTTPTQAGATADASPMPTAPNAIPGMERMTPPPAGFRRREDGTMEPIPGGPQDPNQASAGDRTRLRQIETDAQGILDALKSFRTARNDSTMLERGIAATGIPTTLSTAWTNAALLAKGEALYNLGVLSGPDLSIIQRALSDPATLRGFFTGDVTANGQIDAIETLIRQRVANARRQYGGPQAQSPGPGGVGTAEPPPAASRSAPAPGTVQDGYRFRGGDPSQQSNWERVQ